MRSIEIDGVRYEEVEEEELGWYERLFLFVTFYGFIIPGAAAIMLAIVAAWVWIAVVVYNGLT